MHFDINLCEYIQEVPVETALAYLERRRLEDEYSKLKELKRKAEPHTYCHMA